MYYDTYIVLHMDKNLGNPELKDSQGGMRSIIIF